MGDVCSLTDGNLVDRLHDKRQFIHQPLHILSNCIAAEKAEAGMAEKIKDYDETGR